jgi:hypothetical protein
MAGDEIAGTFGDENRDAIVGKGNSQQVVNVNTRQEEKPDRYGGEHDLVRIEQKIDRTLDRVDDISRRVQAVEIAMQLSDPRRSSQGERLFLWLVVAMSVLLFLINAYAQVLR